MKLSVAFFILMSIFFFSCDKKVEPLDPFGYCTTGTDIMSINNDAIAQSLKDRIFKPKAQSWYIDKNHPNYNHSGKVLVIPVEFPSLPRNTSVTPSVINDAFFADAGFGNDNVNAYFKQASYGQYSITNAGNVDWVTLNEDTAYYASTQLGNDWTRNADLARDICEMAVFDWATVDVNGDAHITLNELHIIFLVSDGGLGANRPSTVVINTARGQYTISNKFCFLSCKSNSDPDKATDAITYNYVTIRHEMMHGLFGLPDRYVQANGFGGNYDPMSANRPRWTIINMVDKIKLGWVTPKILTYDMVTDANAPNAHKCYSFPNSSFNKAGLILYNPTYPDECWVVENRCNDCSTFPNFDSGLPESGLAIWWLNLNTEVVFLVDASKTPGKPQLYPFQNSEALFRFKDKATADEFIPLYPEDGNPAFNFKKVSVPGSTMYAEF